ncbi:MAG: ABC transporter permease [Terracidiphilus sp.]
MRTLIQDLRYAARQLRKSPGFAATAVLTLALGGGATTAIFSCVDGLLLKSLPFEDAGRIAAVAETNPRVAGGFEATYQDFLDWRRQQASFSGVAAYSTVNPDTVSLVIDGRAEQIHRVLASGNYFSVLGVKAQAGRLLDEQDDAEGHDHVAVLSASAWQRLFGGDASVMGRSITLNGASYVVVGVLPQGGAYPADGEVWLPLSLLDKATQQSRVWHSVNVIGRLRPGVTLKQAQAEMQAIAQGLQAAYPATNRDESVVVKPMREKLVGSLRPMLLCLMGAVVLMLLVACANVANLLLVRATENRREVAIRRALGADRGRLIGQLMAQTLLLCLLGGALGTGFAAGALPLLRVALAHTNGLDPALIASIRLRGPELLFTLGVCCLTAVVFGILPATRQGEELSQALRTGDRGSSGAHAGRRAILIASEIAVAVVVVFLGTLLMRSFAKLAAVDPGFRTDHLLSAEVWLPEPRYTDSSANTVQFFEQVLQRIGQTPGVTAVGTTTQVPMRPSNVMTRFLIEGAPALTPGTYPYAQIRYVNAGLFSTLGLKVKAGRVFTPDEVTKGAGVFVVNETFARRYLGGEAGALGRKILIGVMGPHPAKIPVVGVVANAHDLGVDTEAMPEMYLPGFGEHAVLLVRSKINVEQTENAVNAAVRMVDPQVAAYHVETIDAVVSDSMARQRMTATLLAIFGLATLLLAAIGIYGVLSYSVAQRTREIGVRIALGADRGDVLQLVLRQAGAFTAAGIGVGIAVGVAGARLVSGMGLLFETTPLDAMAVCVAIGALLTVAAIAVIVPAARATAVNPVTALKAE